MTQATIQKAIGIHISSPKKRIRVRRTKSTEKFRNTELFRSYQEYIRRRRRMGHSTVGFPQSEEEIFKYVTEMKIKCKDFRSWDQYRKWVAQSLLDLYKDGDWIDKTHANTFYDSLSYIPAYIHLAVTHRDYDVALAQCFAMLIFGNLRTCLQAAESDSALQALYHVFLLERHRQTPQESLFRATIFLRIDNHQMAWSEALQKANAEGQYIGQKTFERNFNSYLKALRKELAAMQEDWSNYPKE